MMDDVQPAQKKQKVCGDVDNDRRGLSQNHDGTGCATNSTARSTPATPIPHVNFLSYTRTRSLSSKSNRNYYWTPTVSNKGKRFSLVLDKKSSRQGAVSDSIHIADRPTNQQATNDGLRSPSPPSSPSWKPPHTSTEVHPSVHPSELDETLNKMLGLVSSIKADNTSLKADNGRLIREHQAVERARKTAEDCVQTLRATVEGLREEVSELSDEKSTQQETIELLTLEVKDLREKVADLQTSAETDRMHCTTVEDSLRLVREQLSASLQENQHTHELLDDTQNTLSGYNRILTEQRETIQKLINQNESLHHKLRAQLDDSSFVLQTDVSAGDDLVISNTANDSCEMDPCKPDIQSLGSPPCPSDEAPPSDEEPVADAATEERSSTTILTSADQFSIAPVTRDQDFTNVPSAEAGTKDDDPCVQPLPAGSSVSLVELVDVNIQGNGKPDSDSSLMGSDSRDDAQPLSIMAGTEGDNPHCDSTGDGQVEPDLLQPVEAENEPLEPHQSESLEPVSMPQKHNLAVGNEAPVDTGHSIDEAQEDLASQSKANDDVPDTRTGEDASDLSSGDTRVEDEPTNLDQESSAVEMKPTRVLLDKARLDLIFIRHKRKRICLACRVAYGSKQPLSQSRISSLATTDEMYSHFEKEHADILRLFASMSPEKSENLLSRLQFVGSKGFALSQPT